MENEIVYLFLGWLFGLLSPSIAERVKRHYQLRDVRCGIDTELKELKNRLVSTVCLLASRSGKRDRQNLQWSLDHFKAYDGVYAKPQLIENTKNLLALSDEQLAKIGDFQKAPPGEGLRLKTYRMPFLEAHITFIPLFDLRFQSTIFEVLNQLSFLNEEVALSRFYDQKTFDSNTPANHDILLKNLEDSYINVKNISMKIVGLIDTIKTKGIPNQSLQPSRPRTGRPAEL